MDENQSLAQVSEARRKKREQIVTAAHALLGEESDQYFDPVHSPLCAIDIVMVAGAPWLKVALEQDYAKDESCYKKIGGGANTPEKAYFFRSTRNLMHFLKRQGLYIPHGGSPAPASGMACFFDWDDRGRFNFRPDRCGIIVEVKNCKIHQVVVPQLKENTKTQNYTVKLVDVTLNNILEQAIIGYSDLP